MRKFYFEYNTNALIIAVTFLLTFIGILFIYSAEVGIDSSIFKGTYIKQIIFFHVAVVFLIFFSFYNYYNLVHFGWYFYFLGIILLISVLIFGKTVNGSQSWFDFGFISFQPSEITKIFLIVSLASFIERNLKNIQSLFIFLSIIFFSFIYIGLILLQPDIGTAIVYLPITFFMLLLGGAKIRHIVSFILVGLLSFAITLYFNLLIMNYQAFIDQESLDTFIKKPGFYSFIFSQDNIKGLEKIKNLKKISKKTQLQKTKKTIKDIFSKYTLKIGFLFLIIFLVFFISYFFIKKYLGFKRNLLNNIQLVLLVISLGFFVSFVQQRLLKPHHIQRLIGFTNLEKDKQGMNYNQRQSVIAIGSGGFQGHGLFNGPQTHLNYIPENQTDFIFAVISEEIGFKGSSFILFLYIFLLYQTLAISYQAKDYSGSLIGIGIASLFFSHIFINIGMALGILPVMGIPLPFLSAGGSSLITNFIGIGILLNISKRRFVMGSRS